MEQSVALSRFRRTNRQIEDLVNEFKNSNCTVKEFCLTHGISEVSFYRWQSRFKTKFYEDNGFNGFAKVVVEPMSATLFAEVKGIRLYQAVSAGYLKELIA